MDIVQMCRVDMWHAGRKVAHCSCISVLVFSVNHWLCLFWPASLREKDQCFDMSLCFSVSL